MTSLEDEFFLTRKTIASHSKALANINKQMDAVSEVLTLIKSLFPSAKPTPTKTNLVKGSG